MVGEHHYSTTAYHPSANGMVERLHRQMKAAIMCHSSGQWTEVLPLVLLGIRSAWKPDIEASPAEFDYQGSSSHQQMTTSQLMSLTLQHEFAFVANLSESSHVFLRQDFVRPLEPPYAGPYKILQRQPNYYKLDVRGKVVTVSIDRLKLAYIIQEADEKLPSVPEPLSPPPVPAEEERKARSGRRVHFTDYYRPQ